MLSEALSRGLLPFLPQLPSNLQGIPTIQALTSGSPLASPPSQGDQNSQKHRCNLCGFESDNAADYENHLNNHFDHRCPYCDYTSKTEGRLKRHVKDFHESVPSTETAATSFTSSTGPGSQNSESDDSSSLQNVILSLNNSQGNTSGPSGQQQQQKPRISKCKTCGFVAETKTEFWEHSKMHIKQGKMLECPQCPFVTEYKHHLEYHLRNHFGSKPFKCAKCNYSCVNKSMLNSHMKSHSNVYQYRCEDCNYATKYCHSLKLHLRKYGHKPAVVLNPDGTPNPYPIIDVYGTRRGPRPKKGSFGNDSKSENGMSFSNNLTDSTMGRPFLQTPLANLLQNSGNWINFPFGWPSGTDASDRTSLPSNVLNTTDVLSLLPSQIAGHTLLPSEEDTDCETSQTQLETSILSEIASSVTELSSTENCQKSTSLLTTESSEATHEFSDSIRQSPAMPTPEQSENDLENGEHPIKSEPVEWNRTTNDLPLDLSRSAPHSPVAIIQSNQQTTIKTHSQLPPEGCSSSSSSFQPEGTNKQFQSSTTSNASSSSSSSRRKGRAAKLETFQCDFCDMLFKDAEMFSIHMNYHGFEDPFKCHVCGLRTTNRLEFFVHLTRDPHN